MMVILEQKWSLLLHLLLEYECVSEIWEMINNKQRWLTGHQDSAVTMMALASKSDTRQVENKQCWLCMLCASNALC